MLTISTNYQALQAPIKDYRRSPEDEERMNAVEDLELQLNATISLRDQLRVSDGFLVLCTGVAMMYDAELQNVEVIEH